MGQPEDLDQIADTKDTVRRSYASQSSDDSLLLSGSSKESCGSASAGAGGWSQASDGQPLVVAMPNQAHRSTRVPAASAATGCKLCAKWHNMSEGEKQRELIKTAWSDPDRIRWKNPTRTVKLERDDKGSLGFKYKDVKGERFGKMHTLVSDVSRHGPAFRKLGLGDCILSANGKPLDSSKGQTLRSVVSLSKTQPVCLIIQHPEGFSCERKCSRKHRPQRSISQERVSEEDKTREPRKPFDRMDSGEMSTNSSHTSKSSMDRSDIQPISLDDRLQALADSDNFPRLDTLMPRLPSLRVLIAGSEAESLATSLLRGLGRAQPSVNDIGVSYRACVSKTASRTSMNASHEDPKEWITGLLESVADEGNLKPDALSDRVELEIIALKSHPFSIYCQHVLTTAHSIFVVQFRCQDFLSDKQSVLLDIQRRLNKIRTYASNRAPVYLVMTVEDSLPAEQLTAIGQSLHRQFATAFMNQLQYNPTTNCPCFQVVRTIPQDNHSKLFMDLGQQAWSDRSGKAEQCCIVPSKENGSLNVCYSAKSTAPTSISDPQTRRFDVGKLRDHISQNVLDQRFIADRYPFSCLLYRERVQDLKKNGPHYAFKAGIKKTCRRISSEKELQILLHFLHHSGDIICADFLGNRSSNVLLDRQYLIAAAKLLTTIPSLSQQQDPNLQDSIQHWRDLGEKSTASSAFLEHLLRKDPENDPENLLTTLSLMGLIHCLQQPDSLSPTTSFLVPFFLPHEGQHRPQQPPGMRRDSYQLCLDFHGCIPDGLFMVWLMQLLKKAWKTNGRWIIDGPGSASLSLSNDCEMDVVCDELQSIVTVSARCSVTYSVLGLLALITSIVDDLKSVRTNLRVTIGPPCPLPPHQCEVRAGEPGKTHVMDISKGRALVPLWCGDRRVDRYPEVDHWLVKVADFTQVSTLPSLDPIQVSLRTHIKKLPPALFNWLCNQLNASPTVGRDWQGLAGVLGYNVGDVKVFMAQRQSVFDPCSSLLLDWACRANATLGALVQKLGEKPLERSDILMDLGEKWYIVQ